MASRFVLLALVFGSLLVLGCTQPAAPSATPTPVISVAPSIMPEPSPSIMPEPSVTPSIETSPTPSPSSSAVAKSKPSLSEFAFQVHEAANAAFNDTRDMREINPSLWVQDDFAPKYQYTLSVKPSQTRGWSSFDTVRTLMGEDGSRKEASVKPESFGAYYRYQATVKCFDASYDVSLDLKDYFQDASGTLRKDLGPAVMAKLVPVCPN